MKLAKVLGTIALALSLSAGAFAQEGFVFGVKGGIQGNWIPGTLIDANDKVVPNFGFSGGVFLMRSFSDMVFGQAELLYSRKGVSTSKMDSGSKYMRTIHYLQLPVLVGFKLSDDRFFLMLGPELGYRLGTNVKDGSVIPDPSSVGTVNPFYLWFALQSTYWVTDALGIDVKGDFGITRVFKEDAKILGATDKGRNLSLSIGVSYRFGY